MRNKHFELIIIVLLLFASGCSMKSYTAKLNQPQENVLRIELLDTHGNNEVLLYTIADSEINDFWDKMMDLLFGKYFNDPATEYGLLAIRIYYLDGHIDMIGTQINGYYSPSGESLPTGWYYALDESEFISLFQQYVDIDLS